MSGIALSALFSFIYSKRKKKKTKIDVSYIEVLDLFEDLERNCYEDLSSEDKMQILNVKEVLCEFIVNRSNKKILLSMH